MVEDAGCKLVFLPRYSPDYNPIEYSFSVLKAALKREDYIREDQDEKDLTTAVIQAAAIHITKSIARNQFQHCFIRVPSI